MVAYHNTYQWLNGCGVYESGLCGGGEVVVVLSDAVETAGVAWAHRTSATGPQVPGVSFEV